MREELGESWRLSEICAEAFADVLASDVSSEALDDVLASEICSEAFADVILLFLGHV